MNAIRVFLTYVGLNGSPVRSCDNGYENLSLAPRKKRYIEEME